MSVVSGHIRGLTNTIPLHVEILYNEYQFSAAFAVASLLTLLAIVTLAHQGGRRAPRPPALGRLVAWRHAAIEPRPRPDRAQRLARARRGRGAGRRRGGAAPPLQRRAGAGARARGVGRRGARHRGARRGARDDDPPARRARILDGPTGGAPLRGGRHGPRALPGGRRAHRGRRAARGASSSRRPGPAFDWTDDRAAALQAPAFGLATTPSGGLRLSSAATLRRTPRTSSPRRGSSTRASCNG